MSDSSCEEMEGGFIFIYSDILFNEPEVTLAHQMLNVGSASCNTVVDTDYPEALRNVITIRHPPRPRYQTQFMLFKTLLVFIMRNRVLLLAVIVCLSMFVLSFIMFLLNEAGMAFWRTST